ncbi:unnamed protein product, partial [Prorocentrum cordatum]
RRCEKHGNPRTCACPSSCVPGPRQLSRGRGPQSSGPGPPRIGRSRAALAARTPLLAARYREAAAHGEACQALLREELGDSDPRLCDAGPMSLPRRALGLVLTRSFVLSTPGGQSSVAMLPLLDLLNHADGDGVRTPRRTCFCVQEGGSVLMVAERDISPGEEVTHAYSEAASRTRHAHDRGATAGGAAGLGTSSSSSSSCSSSCSSSYSSYSSYSYSSSS